jgi:phosphohistidine phosphatase
VKCLSISYPVPQPGSAYSNNFRQGTGLPLSRLMVNESLYMGGEDAILRIIARTDNDINSLMIFGHNPDFTNLANYFLKDQIYNIPTCGLVRLNFDVTEWEQISNSKLVDSLFDFPKKVIINQTD